MHSIETRAPRPVAARPQVLVLMATFNGGPWVAEQVRSIIAQRDVEVTLVVRDDASEDDTLAQIEACFDPTERPRTLRASKPGGSASRNFFRLILEADASGFDYVALADQDDVWESGKLARAVSQLAGKDAVGYSAAVRAFWPDGRSAILRQSRRFTSADYLFEGGGQGCTYVLRASAYGELRAQLSELREHLDALHYHDWTLYALCRVGGFEWFIDDWVCLRYRQHAGNDTGARAGLAALAKRLALVRSGWYGAQIDAIARLCVAAGGDGAAVAERYLRYSRASSARPAGRFRLGLFAFFSGRRRLADRVVVAWAGLSGWLDPARQDPPAARGSSEPEQ